MDATDIAPTRLERAKQKVRDLMKLRSGARTGLVVYAGSAHRVVPPAEDPAVMDLFLPSLATDLMPTAGRNSGAALQLADQLLAQEAQGGTILFIADDFDAAQLPAFTAQPATKRQILMLAVGTRAGGPLKTANGIALDTTGVPVRASFDRTHFEKLASAAAIPLASVTLDDDDVRWVQRRAQAHLQHVEAGRTDTRWRESGYWLCIPITLLSLLWFRRGWLVRWSPVLLIAAVGLSTTQQALADPLDWFATADQQGRWQFEHANYADAATRFDDAEWKGFAYYRAGDYANAIAQFATLAALPGTAGARAYFMLGNCEARLQNYPRAIAAYDNALRQQADFKQAAANRTLVQRLLAQPRKPEEEGAQQPDIPPDPMKIDNKPRQGGGTTPVHDARLQQQAADLWMRNLSVSPAEFLRTKFSIQAGAAEPALQSP
jgi:Ca-activated chloride channel family protein